MPRLFQQHKYPRHEYAEKSHSRFIIEAVDDSHDSQFDAQCLFHTPFLVVKEIDICWYATYI